MFEIPTILQKSYFYICKSMFPVPGSEILAKFKIGSSYIEERLLYNKRII